MWGHSHRSIYLQAPAEHPLAISVKEPAVGAAGLLCVIPSVWGARLFRLNAGNVYTHNWKQSVLRFCPLC